MTLPKISKPIKVALGVLSVIMLFMCLIMACSPVLRYVINHNGQDLIGRDMQVGKVFVNPWNGSVSLSDFSIQEAQDTTDFISFDRLYVRISLSSLVVKKLNIRRLTLVNPSVRLAHNGQRFNFTDIIERFASNDTLPADTVSSSWRIELNKITLDGGNLLYSDIYRQKQWEIRNIKLYIPGLYFTEQESNAGLTFDLPTGGSINLAAAYVMTNNRYDLSLRLKEVNSDFALSIVQDFANVRSLGAMLNGDLHINGSLDDITNMRITGNLNIDQLKIKDKHKDVVLSWESLKMGIHRINPATNTFMFDSIAMYGLNANYQIDNDGDTFAHLLRKQDADSTSVSEGSSSDNEPMRFSVDKMTMQRGCITYTDLTMRKDFSYKISDINLTANRFSLIGNNEITLSAQLSKKGKLKATYKGDFDLAHGTDVLQLQLSQVEVKDLSPFTESLMAYPIKGGELSLRSTTTIEGHLLNGDNRLEIQDMEVGRKQRLVKAPYSKIPLRTCVNLLKSSKGLIVIELPVRGDINSPKFSYKQIIGRAIGKIFLGPLMGVSEKSELQEIFEEIGDSTLMEDLEGFENPENLENGQTSTLTTVDTIIESVE